MLQQTQVKTVLPYFDRWLQRFPDFASLAAAPEADVLKQWEGLGYYSRARNLHRLARVLITLPEIPTAASAWREFPGVGPYTAAAVTSIAFGSAEACVDGNVVRILARLTANPTEFRDSAHASQAFTPLARELLSPEAPGDHNQAMMELGATVCLRQHPSCAVCPVRRWCAGAQAGSPARFPRLAPRTIERKRVIRIWILRNRALLLHRAAPDARRLAGLHELPTAEQLALEPGALTGESLLARKKRGITRYAITESIHRVQRLPRAISHPELVWVPLSELSTIPLSGPHRRWIAELLRRGGSASAS